MPLRPWTYARLQVPFAGMDAALVAAVRPLFLSARAEGLADRAFFLRYEDGTGPHLRVRLRAATRRGAAARLEERVARALRLAVAAGLAADLAFDRYEPELAIYGNAAGVDLAEEAFAAGSAAALGLLASMAAGAAPTAPEAAVLLWDASLRGLRLDRGARRSLLRAHAAAGGAGGPGAAGELAARFEAHRETLASLLGPDAPASLRTRCGGDRRAARALVAYRRRLGRIGRRLRAAARAGRLGRPVATFARRFLHLEANRLGLDPSEETALADLVARALPAEEAGGPALDRASPAP